MIIKYSNCYDQSNDNKTKLVACVVIKTLIIVNYKIL